MRPLPLLDRTAGLPGSLVASVADHVLSPGLTWRLVSAMSRQSQPNSKLIPETAMRGPKRQPIEIRFAAYVVKASDDECWGWTGPVTNGGQPTIGRGGKGAGQISARALAYRLAFGAEPDREVLVTCDKKCCLNPRHLVLAGGAKSKATLQKRFEERVAKTGPDECWLWKLKPSAAGYGCLSMGKGNNPLLAHRVAWQLAHGAVPEGLFVKQRCANRLCCNPAHLYLSLNPIDGPEVSAIAVENWLRSRT